MLETLIDIFSDYTLRNVLMGAAVLGICSGTLGVYAFLRQQSLLGDSISHAALPGIALAFLLTGSKAPLVLLLGAALAGWLSTLVVLSIIRTTRIKEDAALGIVLSVFFGFGLVLLTYIQKLPNANQAGLDKFLFGQAATILAEDVFTMSVLGFLSIACMLLFWKEFKILSFDNDYGASLGFPMRGIDIGLTTLLVIAIVLGLQMVGVVLMSAMVVAPAAAARQWTNRLGSMVILSGFFGALAGVGGAIISSQVAKLPTGPTIVTIVSALVVLSLLFAPARGLVWKWFRQRRNRIEFHTDAVLLDLYALALQHQNLGHAHSARVLKTMNLNRYAVNRCLRRLQEEGFIKQMGPGTWGLSDGGVQEAKHLLDNLGGVSK